LIQESQIVAAAEFTCGACGATARQRVIVPIAVLDRIAQMPIPSLPDGWTRHESELYCSRHKVKVFVRLEAA
jgi:hypothetical protein